VLVSSGDGWKNPDALGRGFRHLWDRHQNLRADFLETIARMLACKFADLHDSMIANYPANYVCGGCDRPMWLLAQARSDADRRSPITQL
jgi:hypothetical protein